MIRTTRFAWIALLVCLSLPGLVRAQADTKDPDTPAEVQTETPSATTPRATAQPVPTPQEDTDTPSTDPGTDPPTSAKGEETPSATIPRATAQPLPAPEGGTPPPGHASCPASQNGQEASTVSLTFQSRGSGTIVGTAPWAAGPVTEPVTAEVTQALANVPAGTPITLYQYANPASGGQFPWSCVVIRDAGMAPPGTPPAAGLGAWTFAWEWSGAGAPTWHMILTRTSQDQTQHLEQNLTAVDCPPEANLPGQTPTPPSTTTPVSGTSAGQEPPTDTPESETTPPSTGPLRTFCGTMACPGGGAYSAILQATDGTAISVTPLTEAQEVLRFGMDAQCQEIAYDDALKLNIPLPPPGTTPGTPPETPPPVAEQPGQTPGQTPERPPTQTAGGFEGLMQQFGETTSQFTKDQAAISTNLTEAVSKVKTLTPAAFRQLVEAQNVASAALFEAYAAYIVQWADLVQAWAQEQVASIMAPGSVSQAPTPAPGTTAGEIVQGASPGQVMTLKPGIWGTEVTIVTPQVTGQVSSTSTADTKTATPEGTTTTSTTDTEAKPVQAGTTKAQTSATRPKPTTSAKTATQKTQSKKETTP